MIEDPTPEQIKPRAQWDADDHADYMDGWHEASKLGFKSKRRRDRLVQVMGADGLSHTHASSALMKLGAAQREQRGFV